MVKRAVLAVLVACVGPLAACANTDCALELCDVRDAECQRAALEVAQCVRGRTGGEAVPVRVVDADRYIDEQVAAADDETDEDLPAWYSAYALFSLSEPHDSAAEPTRTQLQRVIAFYSTDARSITILDRGAALDDLNAGATLVHEMIHALQDQEGAFELFDEEGAGTTDRSLALAAMIEGQAVFYEDLALAHAYGFDPAELDLTRAYAAYEASSTLNLDRSPEPLVTLRSYFAYPFGGGYVSARWYADGPGAVAGVLDDPPRSQRQVLFGAGEHDREADAFTATSLRERAIPVAPGFRYVGSDQLGTFGVLAFMQQQLADYGQPSVRALRGIESDVFSVLADGPDVIATWRIRFESADEAERFADLVRDVRAEVHDRDLVLVASSPGVTLSEPLEWTAAPAEESAEPIPDGSARHNVAVLCHERNHSNF